MKRLLCIISCMNTGGAETFLMKLYRKMDRSKYQMDFCLNSTGDDFYEKEIKELCGKIYRIPSKSQDLKGFKHGLTEIIKNNQYKYVLRITSNAAGFMDLKIAKKAGVEICIARSSNSNDAEGWKSAIAHRLGKMLYFKYVDVKVAPSDLAAKYTFGAKAYEHGDVSILHNAIDLDIFKFSEEGRKLIRKEFGLQEDELLCGHVGRFMTQKNHSFMLDVFADLYKQNSKTKMILVGAGELENDIRDKANNLKLGDAVIFAGVRKDIPNILSAMDVFIFPSLYEGMPNTVIEAQATGLPCVISDTITYEANITDLVTYLPLNDVKKWVNATKSKIVAMRGDYSKVFIDKKYDINSIVKEFVSLVFGEDDNEL